MLFLLTAAVLCVHVLLWGAGLALLITPRRWRSYWPIHVPAAGLALQSVVVWIGTHTSLAGTDAYAWWSELIPLLLLAGALGRKSLRSRACELRKFWALGVIMAGCLVLLTLPVSRTSHVLTSASIGSCDAADYAAGARVFQEFSRDDRSGFMGLTEVVRVGSTNNFFDFWLVLNHFTPSALIAFNGSILGLQPWQITSLLTVVMLVLVLPMVFWLARTGFRFGAVTSLWLALIYGINPITWYAVYHVALAQILAALGIALVTWCGLMLWRERHTAKPGWAYGGLLAVAYAIIWGGYNFIVVVCWVPAVSCVGGWALWSGEMTAFWRWLRRMCVPLGLAGLFFHERVTGLAERFLLFQQTDFGWKIPLLMPEGWLGLVGGTGLQSWDDLGAWLLCAATLLMLAAAWFRLFARRGREAWLIVAIVLPVMLGYGYLEWRGWSLNNNASYDAYKLFAVFYPLLLIAFCPWLYWLRECGWWRGLAVAMVVVVTIGNVRAMRLFSERMGKALLVVEPSLAEVERVEALPQVHSVNVIVPDFWARLWANAFMLRKAQYFPTHTYEGRLNTPLRGEWDFNGGMVQVKLPGADGVKINERFSLARVGSPYFIRARLGHGWYGTEILRARQTRWWNWSRGRASLELENPHARPQRVILHFKAHSVIPRDLQVWIGTHELARVEVERTLKDITVPCITVPPGRVTIDLRSSVPPVQASATDSRLLGFAVYEIVVEVLPGVPET